MSEDKVKIVVGGVPEHFNLPWHLALESNQFDEVGVEVDFREIGGGTGAMMSGLKENDLDVAIVLTEGSVAAIAKGNPSSIVKTYVQSPLIWGIHVPVKSEIETVDGIKGKRYAISRFGSGSHLMAIVDASERGWPTDLEFVKVGNLDGAREALTEGRAENFFWEKFTTAPYVEAGEFRCVGVRKTLWPAFVICVRNEVLEHHADSVKAMLEVVSQSCADLMKSDQACETISARYKLKLEAVKEWFGQTRWSVDFDQPKKALASVTAYLEKLEIVTKGEAESSNVWFKL